MGFLGNLFKSETRTKSQERYVLPSYVTDTREQYYNNNLLPAMTWFSDPNNTIYQGDYVAPVNDTLESGLKGLLSAQDVMPSSAPQQYANLASDYLSGKFRDVSQNQTLNSAIKAAFNPLDYTFQQQTIPTINSSAVSQGAWGNNRVDLSQAQAARDLNQVKANTASQMTYDEAKRQEDLQLAAPQMFQTAVDMASWKPNAQVSVGEKLRGYDQEAIDAQRQKYEDAINGVQLMFQPFQSMFGEIPSVEGTNSRSETTQKGAMIDKIVQLAAIAAAAFAASDRRLKYDIHQIGVLRPGINLYEFRYKTDGIKRIGVMADEVIKVMPEAVVTMPSGYMGVRYGMLL